VCITSPLNLAGAREDPEIRRLSEVGVDVDDGHLAERGYGKSNLSGGGLRLGRVLLGATGAMARRFRLKARSHRRANSSRLAYE